MTWRQGIPPNDWDTDLFAAGGPFLQSSHWAAFQQELGKKVFFARGDGWQCLTFLESSRYSPRIYAPYGPFVTKKQSLDEALNALRQLARQQRALFVRGEPCGDLAARDLKAGGLHPALKNIQQKLTWVKDLSKSEDAVLAEMSATNRNLYRNHAKKGILLKISRTPADMQHFIKMMHEVAHYTGITPHSDRYYQTMADVLIPRQAGAIYLATLDGTPIASAFVFDSPTTRYYAHAASFSEHRKLHAGSPLLSQMIFDAKTSGHTTFDFCGVAPEGAPPTHRWAGFTKFKQSFGGDYKAYLGTWELPAHLGYYLYRGVYKTKKLLRR